MEFTRWSNKPPLAASHLQGPESIIVNLDHLLSLVGPWYALRMGRRCTAAMQVFRHTAGVR
jgi:hypothetical protein